MGESSSVVAAGVRYYVPDDLVALYVHNLVVQTGAGPSNEVMLSFFQAQPPIVVTEEQAAALTEVPNRCVAKVIATPELIVQMIGVMVGQLIKAGHLQAMEDGGVRIGSVVAG